jgi:hypothetical protein
MESCRGFTIQVINITNKLYANGYPGSFQAFLSTSLADRWFGQILCWHSDHLYPQHPLLLATTTPRQQGIIRITGEGEFIWETKLWAVIIRGAVSHTELFMHCIHNSTGLDWLLQYRWIVRERVVELKIAFGQLIKQIQRTWDASKNLSSGSIEWPFSLIVAASAASWRLKRESENIIFCILVLLWSELDMKSPQRYVITCRWRRSFFDQGEDGSSLLWTSWLGILKEGNRIACLSIRGYLNVKSEFYNQNMRNLLLTIPRWRLKIRKFACIFGESRSPLKRNRLKNFNLCVQEQLYTHELTTPFFRLYAAKPSRFPGIMGITWFSINMWIELHW